MIPAARFAILCGITLTCTTLRADEPSLLHTLHGHERWVLSIAISPDGNQIASASWDRTIRLWNARTGEHVATLHGHTSELTSVVFTPCGSRVISASEDRTVRIWNTKTGAPVTSWAAHDDGVLCIATSPDGQYLASGSKAVIRLWKLN